MRHDSIDQRDLTQLRMPPQDVYAEQAVLGGFMLAPDSLHLISDWLHAEDFYRRDHQLIYRAILELAEKGKPYDAVTLGDWFETQGLIEQVAGGAYLIELASTTPSAANIAAYADIVRDKARLRMLITIGTGAVNDGFQTDGRKTDEIIADVQAKFSELEPRQRGGLTHVSESMDDWIRTFIERYEKPELSMGMPTPWREYNEITLGLRPGELTLIAARPSMGKSIMGLNLALFSSQRGVTTGIFSLEMTKRQCNDRNVASLTRLPHKWIVKPIKENRQSEDDDREYFSLVNQAIKDIKASPLFIDDTSSLTVRQFETRARRMHRQHPLGLLVLDHIHDFRINPAFARFEIGEIAQRAKDLGKEWGIPVVALAQLNRSAPNRAERRPTLVDLRESGELEQKADVIVFLHREDYYDTPSVKTHLQGVVEAHFAKGRDLQVGQRILLRNSFTQMRLDDWDGPVPQPVVDIAAAQEKKTDRWAPGRKPPHNNHRRDIHD